MKEKSRPCSKKAAFEEILFPLPDSQDLKKARLSIIGISTFKIKGCIVHKEFEILTIRVPDYEKPFRNAPSPHTRVAPLETDENIGGKGEAKLQAGSGEPRSQISFL